MQAVLTTLLWCMYVWCIMFSLQSLSQALLQLRADMVSTAEENVQVHWSNVEQINPHTAFAPIPTLPSVPPSPPPHTRTHTLSLSSPPLPAFSSSSHYPLSYLPTFPLLPFSLLPPLPARSHFNPAKLKTSKLMILYCAKSKTKLVVFISTYPNASHWLHFCLS